MAANDVVFKDTSEVVWKNTVGVVWNTAAVVVVVDFMRSMKMAINYEGILEDVTPSDTEDLTQGGMLYVGGAGNVKVTGLKSGTVTLIGVPAGTWLNFCRVKRVWSTGTTATSIVLAR